MLKSTLTGRFAPVFAFAVAALVAVTVAPASARNICESGLSYDIPDRSRRAPGGSAVMASVQNLSGAARDAVIVREVLAGNMPSFMRELTPVTFSGTTNGRQVQITICVTPEYLAVGSDDDFVRAPMGAPAAARIADVFGFYLPTTKMVDAIYAQAAVHLAPAPMDPTSAMSTTGYLVRHNQTVESVRARYGHPELLTAGHKKDIVLTTRLSSARGRVAIYGWHRTNGSPIQPLSTVHGALYADYSHGVRLVSQVAYFNGEPRALASIMENEALARIISSEGPIRNPHVLMASLYR
jgi:hypothetical protein